MKRSITKISLILATAAFSAQFANGQAFTEGFEDITTLPGWTLTNMSNPAGTEDWAQGYSTLANQTYYFTANSGSDSSFICGSFNNTSGAGIISNWLISPPVALTTGDVISFWTRSTDLAGTVYPDRLQVWHSLVASTNVGVDENSIGDFTENLFDINGTYTTTDYPFIWTLYSSTLSLTAPVTGNFAWRYFVEDGGPSGANSFLIGIDDVTFAPGGVGINQNSKQGIAISAYPNPAIDQITFDLGAALSSNAAITVTNELGKTVMHGNMNKGTKAQIVDISKLSAGTYIIQVTDADGNVYRSHFAKQ
ncbi:MAG: choice-of-anchor J domain-containing protein [Bacteroidota bacterium]